ncbi:ATP-binding cassette domain-containing protein [Schleiferilactobacillus harbinensis]|jgi:ABC-2 type transport system ATP-binding protein|uniref:ATP-binding cassette domain-containing protein n=1 Tax=Schleiferilactobacillus harbinensis TaxID=304207 RepID=UPI00242FA6CD|nr:ATP-binding cassette domain-containing protein [Schleiferilactobacillus harbinensis]MCI1686616.1 ATP-binding cassette domain-containing protein [Schleiferilactobacillus harbinensis]MCI1784047.1 ATP-binding cassette domain-containing protein [Schleiferilactobacillus harbinensis]MCI1849422.1 ATP-binding cassette domain-containing protein [Schleiferilactobacillus harbinensis]
MDVVLEARNVTKQYPQQLALDNLNLTVHQGDIYGLVGRNGAGKTTLLKTLLQLIAPTAGTVTLFEEPVDQAHIAMLRRVGSIIETPSAFGELTALENMRYFCLAQGIVTPHAAEDSLQFVGLTGTGKKKVKNFSLGMKQKLGLALAILKKPDLLLLDEPINGLDPIAIADFRQLLLKLNREQNTTILISSHILDELFHLATRFGFIDQGRMVRELTKDEFVAETAQYIRIETSDMPALTRALTNAQVAHFKVVAPKELHVFDEKRSISALNQALVSAGVPVTGISQEGQNLEDYFKMLLSDTHQEVRQNA